VNFKKKEIEFLGMIIGEKGVKMDSDKSGSHYVMADAEAHEGCPSIFGTCPTFTARFIQNFSKIATPLNNLMCKETVWRWGETQQKAFDELKKRFVEGPILGRPPTTHAHYAWSLTLCRFCDKKPYYQCYVKTRSGTHVHFYQKV